MKYDSLAHILIIGMDNFCGRARPGGYNEAKSEVRALCSWWGFDLHRTKRDKGGI